MAYIFGVVVGACVTYFLVCFGFFEKFINTVIGDRLEKAATMHFGRAAKGTVLQQEVNELRKELKSARKARRRALNDFIDLAEILEVWKEGVEKGCDAEAIEEQVRWKQDQEE